MDQVLDVQGIATRCRSAGAGPDVLVLHGWGASIEAVGSIVSALAPSCSVHAVDLPGFGQAGPPPRPWGVEDYSDWVRALLGSLGLSRVSIVGHSHGGRVAIHLAAHHPELVDRLVLVDAAGVRAPRTWRWYRRVAMAKLAKHVLNRLGPGGRALGRRLVGRTASADYAATDEALRPTFNRLVAADLTPLLPRVRASTLLIWGEHDADTPLRDGETMERLIPDAGLVVFEGAGHFSYAEQPQRFARVVRHFLGPAPTAAAANQSARGPAAAR
ncbi:MAG TPA: alpha/beta fold hydrolase [Solirubrobacteraceae bacterium]|nr:alpha/beta fold hydrolase [Solirubrobacteraceae bacterium]